MCRRDNGDVRRALRLVGVGIRARLARSVGTLDDAVRAQLNYPRSARDGVVVVAITSGGPASKVDLSPGDVIQQIDGKEVRSVDDVTKIVKAAKIGRSVQLHVWSRGRKKAVTLAVAELPVNLFLQQQP